MTRACHMAVRAATGEVFSEQEIDDLLDRMTQKAKRAKADAPTLTQRQALAQAATELTKDQLMGALVEKRLKVAAEIAQKARRTRLDAMPAGMGPAERLDAYNVGSERQGLGTSASVDAEGRARQMTLWGKVQIGLDKFPGLMDRLSNPFGLAEKGVDRLVAKEMARLNGDGQVEPTGDEGAVHAARVFVGALRQAKDAQNEKGAWINEQRGYIARQSHDAGKVSGGFWRELGELGRRAQANKSLESLDWTSARIAAERRAFGAWRDFIGPKLDDKTFEGIDREDVPFARPDGTAGQAADAGAVLKDPADVREAFLHNVWMDIVTGRHNELSGMDDLGDFRPKASLARSVSKARVLHFKSPDDWVDYNQKFGRSSLFASIMGQLERGGRNAALMERWGPAPEAAFDAEKARLAAEARGRGDVGAVKRLDSYMTQARFEAVTGRADVPENMRIAQVMRTIRGWEALTKLGSIVLSKATDLPLSGHTMARAGAGFLAGYEGFFKGALRLGGEDSKRAADALDVGARSFAGHLGSQFLSSDGAPGWTSWATRLMYKINGFEWFNEGVRRGGAEVYARHLGQESAFGWDGLDAGTRETFERFGISPADWEGARQGLQPAPDGRTYFSLDHMTDPALKLKFATMVHNVLDDTVSEPRAREKAGITRGTKAGTLQGEILRAFFQFKGFINTIVGRHLIPATQGYGGYSPVALVAHFILGTALAGYISMNAKLIAKGQQPRGLVGADLGDTLKVWSAAMAQGGGLGLYGDFLFGEANRNGAEFSISQLAGPIFSDAEAVAKVVLQAVHGGAISETTGRSQIPGELVHIGSQNIPLVNLWYTRLALDYMILWRLQEAASPGYLQRYEERAQQQQGAHYIVPPTSALH